jgi:hypothetical protein
LIEPAVVRDEQMSHVSADRKEKQFMKRYFSNMVDLYPDDSAAFIKAREYAKRMRVEADHSHEAYKKKMLRMFDVYENEPVVDTGDLMSAPSSKQSSAHKR